MGMDRDESNEPKPACSQTQRWRAPKTHMHATMQDSELQLERKLNLTRRSLGGSAADLAGAHSRNTHTIRIVGRDGAVR